jgi:hypothetical protein
MKKCTVCKTSKDKTEFYKNCSRGDGLDACCKTCRKSYSRAVDREKERKRWAKYSLENREMNWDNYGRKGWHIDHIIPLSNFNLQDREQFLKANHFTNLQPLWAEENLQKSDKIIIGDKNGE